jgi:tetratricopeptide (TPR) repeat protein
MASPSNAGLGEAPFRAPLQRAMEAYREGRLNEAAFSCRLVLAVDKKQFDATHLLGLIEFQRDQLSEAHAFFRQAVKINPRSVHALSNLALVLQRLDRHDEALINLNKALAIEPSNALALNNRGHILWRLKRLEEALKSLDQALAVKPDYDDALCNRGNVLVELQRFEEALACYDRALSMAPQDAPTWNNRANTLLALGRRSEAMASYDRAQQLDPCDLSILKDRGSALYYENRHEEAISCFDQALALKPGDIYFIYKRGTVLAKLNRYEEALACFDHALAAQPDNVDALDNRGSVLAALQRAAEAIASYDRALAIKPETAEAHWNRGLTLLRVGDYEHGWDEYEWRWKLPDVQHQPRDFSQPQWLGEPIRGKTILLHAEQGFGDTIHFLRYVPLVAGLGAKVIVEVQRELRSLASRIEGASLVLNRGEALPSFDYHCPLLSLPRAFKTRLETIPSKTPYLTAASEKLSTWDELLVRSGKPRIGIAWAGNATFSGDATRSIGLQRLAPLLSLPHFQFVSLQKDLRAGDDEILRKHPDVVDLGNRLVDFSDTAAIMSLLDLVISSDTAIVHLAGALGRPVWVLLEHLPEWRWLLGRDDSPWYPSARLFRQPASGDWESVVSRVVGEVSQNPSNRFNSLQ